MTDDIVAVAAADVRAPTGLDGQVDAGDLAERGWLYRVGPFHLVLRLLDPPETSVRTVRVITCDERLLTPERWPGLVTALLERFGADRLHLRSTLPADVLEPLGLRVFLHFVAKTVQPREVEGVGLRPAVWPDDHGYVAELMCASLRNGMPQVEFTAEQLDTYVHGYLRLGQTEGCDAVIAWVDGQRVGTAVFRKDSDELNGARITRLIDIMTDEHGHGHGWRIAPAFEAHVAGEAVLADTIVGTVVGEPDGSHDEVVERLRRAGWWLDHTLWTPLES